MCVMVGLLTCLWASPELGRPQGFLKETPLPRFFLCSQFTLSSRRVEYSVLEPLNAWFSDDGSALGKTEEVKRVLQDVSAEGPEHGIVLNLMRTSVSRLESVCMGVTIFWGENKKEKKCDGDGFPRPARVAFPPGWRLPRGWSSSPWGHDMSVSGLRLGCGRRQGRGGMHGDEPGGCFPKRDDEYKLILVLLTFSFCRHPSWRSFRNNKHGQRSFIVQVVLGDM
jgi:hypothetical protein